MAGRAAFRLNRYREPKGEDVVGPLSIEQVLAAEAAAIHDLSNAKTRAIVEELNRLATNQERETDRGDKDADQRSGKNEERDWVRNRKDFYCLLGQLRSAAICCSGGGIRSATFCLGIIQALAKNRLTPLPPQPRTPPDPDKSGTPEFIEAEANQSQLSRFHYLSTVSGGGYIGSWLSAWRSRDDFPTVWQNLSSRPDGADVQPPEISWLRAYSNYLTPRVGLLSADTWTDIAITLRNLLLNWLVIIPAIAVVLVVLKFAITFAVQVARLDGIWWLAHVAAALLGVACLVTAQAFTTSRRPTRRPPPPQDCVNTVDPYNATQHMYQLRDLVWSVLSAFFVTAAVTSKTGALLAGGPDTFPIILAGAVLALPVFALGWLIGCPYKWRGKDFWRWTASGLVYGGLVGLGAHLFTLMKPYSGDMADLWTILVPVIIGLPWVLTAQLFANTIFVGLVSYEENSDADREWLGRASGWVMISAIIWIGATALSFAGGYILIDKAPGWVSSIVASAGGVSGLITALIGKSGSASKSKAGEKGEGSIWSKVGLALAGPLFGAILVILTSVVLDLLLLGHSLMEGLTVMASATKHLWSYGYIYGWLLVGLAVTFVVAWIASRYVNINRFSLHALYRNRLVRAYLGASRQARCPDLFTGFDAADNPKAHELWPPKPYAPTGGNTRCLFHVVNITLNVVKTARLAWQQRKAEAFTVSPLHSGAADKGYRLSREYGGGSPPGGISLGTAMAISGAAASPNMGYHTTTSLALLLALFNVRLGWWLGNPGKEGNTTYREEGPTTAIRPLVEETFALTTDTKPWVYLSDGGHFENLGIYEMVRRRCRFILAIDGGCDPDFTFEDLGNAVRKIYIDLGVRIKFAKLDQLKNRPSAEELRRALEAIGELPEGERPKSAIPYYAIGVINYSQADGPQCEDGIVLYIKPAIHNTSATEGAGVRSYAAGSPTFPHESTADQWFTESQFESYRSLAFDIADTILQPECLLSGGQRTVTVNEILAGLSPTAPNQLPSAE